MDQDISTQIIDDWKFAVGSEEFQGSMTAAMRYVAALNPTTSIQEFAQALMSVGLNRSTLMKQFTLSRRHDREAYNVIVEKDGRILQSY